MLALDLLAGIAIVVGSMTSIALILFGIRLWRADKISYLRNYERSKNKLTDVFRGTLTTKHNGTRDHAMQAGLAVTKNNEWSEQGTLSEEALDSVLSRH
jgi:hypothetical protein